VRLRKHLNALKLTKISQEVYATHREGENVVTEQNSTELDWARFNVTPNTL